MQAPTGTSQTYEGGRSVFTDYDSIEVTSHKHFRTTDISKFIFPGKFNIDDGYVDDNGNWDYDQLNTDMFILNNIDSIIKSVANHYKSQGTEEVVQELKNPSFEGKPTNNQQAGSNDMASQILKAMQENGDL